MSRLVLGKAAPEPREIVDPHLAMETQLLINGALHSSATERELQGA